MKRTFIFCLIALGSIGAFGQKKGKIVKFNPTTDLKTQTDSLSYALGQNMTNGLKDHLVSIEVLADTAALRLEHNIALGKTEGAEKAKLEKAFQNKLAETTKNNEKNYATFVKGLEEAISSTDADKNVYNSGVAIGNQLQSVSKKFEQEMLGGSTLNNAAFAYSVISSLNGEKPTMDNANEYLQETAQKMQQEKEMGQAEELKAQHGERISQGTIFLAQNKNKEGVVVLPSGLQYKVIEEGTGKKPSAMDRVTVHYEGKLLDGTVFDSSYKRGEPATFGVAQVISGWTEALQLMPVGSKWTIYIPYDLAYGERDQGDIKPFSTLIFDVELIKIAE